MTKELSKLEKNDFRKNAYDMIYLAACAVNGKVPKAERVADMSLDDLLYVCKKHSMTAVCAYALESAGIKNDQFKQEKEKAIRKNILLDAERSRLFSRFEEEGIWYIPLKGAILKDWYPALGMRQMSDNDIYFDMSRRDDSRRIMKELGFTFKGHSELVDEYIKEPVYNFELHCELLIKHIVGDIADAFLDMKERKIKDTDNSFGYHFSNEDFYAYMIAHEYKHYIKGGTGVRSLLDEYIFWRHAGDSVDMELINDRLTSIGLADHEKRERALAIKLFTMNPLSPEDKKELDYYIFSGTYGSFEHDVKNGYNKSYGTASYILRRIFPPMSMYKAYFNWAYRHKWLLPVAWCIRTVRYLTNKREKMKLELNMLFHNNKQ